jgi:hypothetical protein
MTEQTENARKRVEEELAQLKGAGARVEPVAGDALDRAFPGSVFVSALFRQYPVARIAPAPLKASNLFAVPKGEGKPQLLTDAAGLKEFFRTNLKPVPDADGAKDVARAWLLLSPTFVQDGFYRFSLLEDTVRAAADGAGITATGKVVVMAGGNGSIDVKAVFDRSGKLTELEQKVDVRPGPRPICQATKLLDPDPIVRRMAEQDLIIMGRCAKPYLDEQRAAATPELRRAIDRIWERIRDSDR